ncbi:hypothetical protein RZS08_53990, partial [Arthrospira platensis SPKY1]|nr:hypothetical protein [Arthrospira platensis SPKY1]
WASISTLKTGAKAGAIIGSFAGLMFNFYFYAGQAPNYGIMLLDVVITIVYSSIMGAVIGFVLGKVKAT